MKNFIELNIEIDAENKTIYIGEDNSSGVEERYERTENIGKYIQKYINTYHEEIKENIENESDKLLKIKEKANFIYEFLKEQNDTGYIDLEKLGILQKDKMVQSGDEPLDLQNYLDKLLEVLWEGFEDILLYEEYNEEFLDEPYLDFKVGTSKEDIWHWFDDRHSKGVHYLLYEYEIHNKDENDSLLENEEEEEEQQ